MKYASRKTEEKISSLFNLGPTDHSQNWEFETIEDDPERLQKMIDGFRTMHLSKEERHTLMALVLNSMTFSLKSHEAPAPKGWGQVVAELKSDREEYWDLIDRFSSPHSEPEDRFYLSPHLVRVFPEILSMPRNYDGDADFDE